jgi:DegV family protein with EDD domain
MSHSIAIVTDSTAITDRGTAAELDVFVVPLQVVIGAESHEDFGPDAVTAEMLAEALRTFKPLSTSRPNPEAFARLYAELADQGYDGIVSIHLSSQLSGTVESAQIAARGCAIPVHVVDSGLVGSATGSVVAAAVEARDAGAGLGEIWTAALHRAKNVEVLFYVDTLEYLRRGGRMNAALALVGQALAMKPILRLQDGRVVQHERVRTASRALARLEELAVSAAGDSDVMVTVSHLAAPERGAQLAKNLTERLDDQLVDGAVEVDEVGAVVGAHVGPGMVAVAVSKLDAQEP